MVDNFTKSAKKLVRKVKKKVVETTSELADSAKKATEFVMNYLKKETNYL